ncbi:MAG: HD domain-containing protein [Bacteroidaceae bacterium]|nr:HD domain-containing protein [Bacteroidaceae bacterium]
MIAEEIIDRYYEGQDELKRLLLLHSRQVADKAVEVLDRHPEIIADREFVYEAAMLHDIGIVYTDAPGIHCHGTHPYICHGMLGAELLRREGLPRHARVAERHTGTGLTAATIKAQGLPLPQADFSPETIEEQIVCYADKFYSKSHPERTKTEEQVRQMLSRFPDASLERWDKWVSLFS